MRDYGRTTADRLTLVSQIEWLDLDTPAFVQPGETYWFDMDSRALFVEGTDGQVSEYKADWRGERR